VNDFKTSPLLEEKKTSAAGSLVAITFVTEVIDRDEDMSCE
jgi:hypothetical protein